MVDDNRLNFLNDSPLWKALLLDKEIRYSDFLGLFIETFLHNPIDSSDIPTKDGSLIEVNREKKHTDLWIDRVFINGEGILLETEKEIRLPVFLIENKLKSIPYADQLRSYTEKFVKEYVNQVKELFRQKNKDFQKVVGIRAKSIKKEDIAKDEYIKNLLCDVRHLQFYLITAVDHKELTQQFIFNDIEKPDIVPLKEENLKFEWKCYTYSDIGRNMTSFLNTTKHEIAKGKKKYLLELFKDFAIILNSMTVFSDAFQLSNFDEKINEFFDPVQKSGFSNVKKMHSLYKKYRASECASELSKLLTEKIDSKSILKLDENEIVINHGFTNDNGLFDVKKCYCKEKLYVIIQYQNKELRKGIVVKDNELNGYKDWLNQQWDHIKFDSQSDGKPYSFKVNHELTYYFFKYQCKNEKVSEIINLMKEKINEKPFIAEHN
jgi:transposase-like protein